MCFVDYRKVFFRNSSDRKQNKISTSNLWHLKDKGILLRNSMQKAFLRRLSPGFYFWPLECKMIIQFWILAYG